MVSTIAKYTGDRNVDFMLHSYAQLERERLKLESTYTEYKIGNVKDKLVEAIEIINDISLPIEVLNKSKINEKIQEASLAVSNAGNSYKSHVSLVSEQIIDKQERLCKSLINKGFQMNNSIIQFYYGNLDEKMEGYGTKIKDELEELVSKNNSDINKGKIEFNLIMHPTKHVEMIEIVAPFNSDIMKACSNYKDIFSDGSDLFHIRRRTPGFEFVDGANIAHLNSMNVPDFTYFSEICSDFISQRPDLEAAYEKAMNKASRDVDLNNEHSLSYTK